MAGPSPPWQRVGFLLFPGFELLDATGPMEMFAALQKQGLLLSPVVTVAERPGPVASAQGVEVVAQHSYHSVPPLDLLVVPGGSGTRTQVKDAALLRWLQQQMHSDQPLTHLFSVCTGAALLGAAGLLAGRRATTNKLAFGWVVSSTSSQDTDWVKDARWVHDGNVLTSAGVSAGMDAALHLIANCFGDAAAEQVARYTEYTGDWRDGSNDPWGPLVQLEQGTPG